MRATLHLLVAVCGCALSFGCEVIDDFSRFHVVSDDAATASDASVRSDDLTVSADLRPPPDGGLVTDFGMADMATATPVYTLRGATSGLGRGRSTGGSLVLSGSIGIPQPRVVSTGGKFTLMPLVPGP